MCILGTKEKNTSKWRPFTIGNKKTLRRATCFNNAISPLIFSLLLLPCMCMSVSSYLGIASVGWPILNITFHIFLYHALCDLHLTLIQQPGHAAEVSQRTCSLRLNAITITIPVRCRMSSLSQTASMDTQLLH